MKRSILFALATVLLTHCSTKEMDIQTPVRDDVVFYASFEQPAAEETRVYANKDLLLRWTVDYSNAFGATIISNEAAYIWPKWASLGALWPNSDIMFGHNNVWPSTQ